MISRVGLVRMVSFLVIVCAASAVGQDLEADLELRRAAEALRLKPDDPAALDSLGRNKPARYGRDGEPHDCSGKYIARIVVCAGDSRPSH